MFSTVTLILGGGRGTRLYPLTKFRSKPAVPLAGNYRLIDIPISNCIHSGLNRIYVLTQFNSVSLHRHIRRTYNFDSFSGGFVEILAAQQTNQSTDWYQGTADAVRQNIRYIEHPGIENVLILSGDQLYRMDYRKMLESHQQSGADVTIAALPVPKEQTHGLGILRLSDSGQVDGFLEKPKTEEELKLVHTDPAWIDAHGIASGGRSYLASMGIYVFKRQTLLDVLTKTDYHDFGKEIFPTSIRVRKVFAHLFDGYWEDIGTVKSFFQANLELASASPPFHLAEGGKPIYSRARFLPPARIDGAQIKHSLVADGCVIEEGAVLENCVVGLRCRVGAGTVIRNSIVMGVDYFQSHAEMLADRQAMRPLLGIGSGCRIEGAIVDKNCRIGDGAQVINERQIENTPENLQCMLVDGIAVIPKDAVLPAGWRLANAFAQSDR